MTVADGSGATGPTRGHRLATADHDEAYLLETGNGRCIKLSATAYLVLTGIDGGSPAEEVARDLSRRLGRVVTADQVETAYAQVRPKVDAIARRADRPKPFGLWFRIRLLPMTTVGGLSRRLSHVFHPVVAGPLAVVVALVTFRTLTGGTAAGGNHNMNMADPGGSFLALLGLFTLSMLAHEIGHASACVRYGASARDIGFGLYLVYPVFYNDVTAAWRLTRRQRVVIDLAGVLFQLSVGATYVLVHHLTGWDVFRLAATSVSLLGLFVLLPLFKFDGYWLLTDLLGVTNLSRQVRRVVTHGLDRLRARATGRLPWPRWVSVAVLVYGAFTVAFLVMFALNLTRVVPDLAAEYPARVAGLVRDLYLPPHSPAPGRLSSVLGPTYVLLGVTLAFVRLSQRLTHALRPSPPASLR